MKNPFYNDAARAVRNLFRRAELALCLCLGLAIGYPLSMAAQNGPVCGTYTNKTTANGLGDNTISGVYAVGTTVYAATNGGLSISTDGGSSFTNKTTANGLGNNYVLSVYAVGTTLYAGTNNGLSISTDGGASFTNKTTANGLGGNSILGVYAVGTTVYAAAAGGLGISTDGGSSFTNKTTANGLGNFVTRTVYAVGSTVYVGTNSGLSISTDGGNSFTNKTTANGLGANLVWSVYAVGSTVYAGTGNGLSISTDGGASFTNKTTANGLGNNSTMGVYVVGSTVYAATAGGLSISTDSGSSFTNYTTANSLGNNTVNGVYATSTTVYAATGGGLSFCSPASAGSALNFDGTDDYVTLPTSLAQAVTTNATALTMEYWFKGTTLQSAIRFQDGNGFIVAGWTGNGAATHIISTDGGINGIAVGAAATNGNWHHIAMTWQKNTANGFKSYLDGQLVEQRASANANLPTINAVGLGSFLGIDEFTNGSLDEVRIWNRALSQCEIQNNMSCELGATQTGLLAYYKFNHGTDNSNNAGITSLTDASGNGYTGTLSNFALTGTTSNWIGTGGVTTGTTCTPYVVTWTGASSTDWETATNWTPNCVPTVGSNVIIPATTNKPTLPANQTIANLSLTGTNKIMLGSSNLIVNALTGGSSSSYVVTDGAGTLTINAIPTSPATLFPVGTSATSYDPVTIQPTSSADFAVKVKATTVAGDFTDGTGNININKVAKRQWDITPTGTPGNSLLTLTNGGTTYTPATAKIGHYKSTNAWEELTATYSENVWTATTTSFSPFGAGDAGGFVAVLSVELLDFKATLSVSGNLLTWITANEVNNKGFQVERLMVSGEWLILGFVNAKGKAATYDFTDNAPLSTSYYRLRQIDNDGKETLSKVISIERKGNGKLKAYPNPVSNTLTIESTDGSGFQIVNLLGQQVLAGKKPPLGVGGINVSALPQGAYVLKVGVEQVKFVKQ